jgi:hypothetical protein
MLLLIRIFFIEFFLKVENADKVKDSSLSKDTHFIFVATDWYVMALSIKREVENNKFKTLHNSGIINISLCFIFSLFHFNLLFSIS